MKRLEGFNLTEMLVVLAIMAILIAIAVPNVSVWMINMKIRNGAQSIKDGLVYAKTEAVRRNAKVQFVLTNLEGAGWQVVLLDDTELSRKATGEGDEKVTVSVPNEGDTVTFNGIGRVVANPEDGAGPSPSMFNIDSKSLTADQSKDLRVLVRASGDIKMCDPNIADKTDPKSCE